MKLVISLGGSMIAPRELNLSFLKEFKKVIRKFSKYKIVIVTGGGKIARDYINALNDKDEKIRSLIGIQATKLNAMLVSNFLDSYIVIPDSLSQVKSLLNKNNIIVCGALGYEPKMTSDGTAANVARVIKADYFVNITNVKGLYDKDPRKNNNAKFISRISFSDFLRIMNEVKFKPGQHFVLDQTAAKIISKYQIRTVILKGNDNLENLLKGKNFDGTLIS